MLGSNLHLDVDGERGSRVLKSAMLLGMAHLLSTSIENMAKSGRSEEERYDVHSDAVWFHPEMDTSPVDGH
jgi:hypothetical protein